MTIPARAPRPLVRPLVFLVGYRATGKSTVGRFLSTLLNVPLEDTDRRVEGRIGSSISSYFATAGEPAFRDRESESLIELIRELRPSGAVVATGGGIVLREENVQAMRAAGRIAWLKAEAETIRRRLACDAATAASRPALSGSSAVDEVVEVLARRVPLYRAAAEFEIETDDEEPRNLAQRIAGWLRGAEPAGIPPGKETRGA